nr:reverse transcriptase domain-containing protein [Tanacetum cinerariifolium]
MNSVPTLFIVFLAFPTVQTQITPQKPTPCHLGNPLYPHWWKNFGFKINSGDCKTWVLTTMMTLASTLTQQTHKCFLSAKKYKKEEPKTFSSSISRGNFENQARIRSIISRGKNSKEDAVQSLSVNVDSKLVASQINGNYEACQESMIKYLAKAKEYIGCFKSFKIRNIPRNQNQKADALGKFASVAFNHLTKEILVKVLESPSTDRQEINTLVEEGDNWMTPVIKCIEKGKCMHLKARSVVAKEIRQGYYWPTIHRDAREEIRKCDSCQIQSPVPKLPKTLMTSIMAPWPFFQWGIDVLGPLPEPLGKVKFVIVAIDYFTKWIEAKPLAKTTGKEVKKFV